MPIAIDVEERPLSASCVRLFTIRGTKFLLHWSQSLLLAFFLVLSFLSAYPSRSMIYSFMFYGPMIFISVLVHETGHLIATRMISGGELQVDEVILWPMGGLSFYVPEDIGYMGDLKVAIAGPLMQIPFLVLLAIIYILIRPEDSMPFSYVYATYKEITGDIGNLFVTLFRTTFWYNVFMVVFNLFVPLYPSDAVRIWTALFRKSGASLAKSATIISFVGMFISVGAMIYGIVEALFFNIFGGGIFVFAIGGFGFINAKALYDTVKAGRLRHNPIFKRSCYEHTDGIEMNTSPTRNSTDRVDGDDDEATITTTTAASEAEIV